MLRPEAHIAHDPYGSRFAPEWARRAIDAGRRLPAIPPPLTSWILYMQVRTRALDDILLQFVESGGRQVVLLGAGYDCRALRFEERLGGVTVFEIDHPATQERKRGAIGRESSAVRYLSWNFETHPVAELPAALAGLGHDRDRPTLTIWEGVTMYLTEGAIDATVRAVRAYSAPESLLALTYFEKRMIEKPTLGARVVRTAVASFGEPFTFGWDPGELDAWFAPRGFEAVSDRSEVELARELLPPEEARRVKATGRHVAVLRTSSSG